MLSGVAALWGCGHHLEAYCEAQGLRVVLEADASAEQRQLVAEEVLAYVYPRVDHPRGEAGLLMHRCFWVG